MNKTKPTEQGVRLKRIDDALKLSADCAAKCRRHLEHGNTSRDAVDDCLQAQQIHQAAEMALSDAMALLTAAEMVKDNLLAYRDAAILAEIQLCYV